MNRYEYKFNKLMLERQIALQATIDELRAKEDVDRDEYVGKLEEALTAKQSELEEVVKQYKSDVPVENNVVGYLSHVGVVNEDED